MSEKNSPVRAPLLPYTAVADLIVQLMGKDCEVVLHDLDTPQHSVVYVAGESVTGRKPGQGFRHLVSELIRPPRETPNITPNWFFRARGKTGAKHHAFYPQQPGGTHGSALREP